MNTYTIHKVGTLEIGKSYVIKAFDNNWAYKIHVTKIENKNSTLYVHGSYSTRIGDRFEYVIKKPRKYKYCPINLGGCFVNITYIRMIKSFII
jgi:hypothetical protein